MMAEPQTPDRAEGLLEQIAETALDDDYYVVRSGPGEQSRQFNTLLTGVVLAVFALMIAIAALQTRSDRPASQRERETLIGDVDARKSRLSSQESTAERLRDEVADLKSAVIGFDPAYEDLRVLTADRGARGPGLRVMLETDEGSLTQITDRDLENLVNALWYAGAEAISVNGERMGSLSAIRVAAGTIKVNYRSIAPPFEIVAIGDAPSLDDRFGATSVARLWDERRDDGQVRFGVTRSDELTVDAAPEDRLDVMHAKAVEGDA